MYYYLMIYTTVTVISLDCDNKDLLLLLAYRPATQTFQLTLLGYLVVLLPWAPRFVLTKIFEKKKKKF